MTSPAPSILEEGGDVVKEAAEEGEGEEEEEAVEMYLSGLYASTVEGAEEANGGGKGGGKGSGKGSGKGEVEVDGEAAVSMYLTGAYADAASAAGETATVQTPMGEMSRSGSLEADWENAKVLERPDELGDRPESRPVTAPTGAFEFDLNKGSWAESGLLLSDYTGGGGGGKEGASVGEASSVVIDEMRSGLARKDKQIEMLMKEIERLNGANTRAEGSVVSDLTGLGL
jgi:hypothetical protein